MASVSVSHMILFIASMVIAASVAGVFTSSVDQLADAIDDQGLEVSDDVRTSIEIISDSGSDNIYNNSTDTVTVLVKNTGTNRLTPESGQIDVLMNGQFQAPEDVAVELLGSGQRWSESEVIRVNVSNTTLQEGDHRVKVIVNGDEDLFLFRLEGQT
jgi:flagellar protein FlaG